jgi:hypothetical protein
VTAFLCELLAKTSYFLNGRVSRFIFNRRRWDLFASSRFTPDAANASASRGKVVLGVDSELARTDFPEAASADSLDTYAARRLSRGRLDGWMEGNDAHSCVLPFPPRARPPMTCASGENIKAQLSRKCYHRHAKFKQEICGSRKATGNAFVQIFLPADLQK